VHGQRPSGALVGKSDCDDWQVARGALQGHSRLSIHGSGACSRLGPSPLTGTHARTDRSARGGSWVTIMPGRWPATVQREPKGYKRFREITEFHTACDRAQQSRVLKTYGRLVRLHPDQFGVRGRGRDAAVRAIVQALRTDGYRFAATCDIRDCFSSDAFS
jgi:hypothetical protein